MGKQETPQLDSATVAEGVPNGPALGSASAIDRRSMRQPASPYDNCLSLSAIAWLRELPPATVPVMLVNHFPRIVNRLARFWDSPRMIEPYFEELLSDPGNQRRGFPEDVRLELDTLAEHYRALREPVSLDPWDETPRRRVPRV